MDIFLTVATVVLGLFLTGIGIEMTINPPAKEDKKAVWTYRVLFGVVGLGICVLTAWQSARAGSAQDRRDDVISSLRGRLGVLQDLLMHPRPNPEHAQLQGSLDDISKQLKVKPRPPVTIAQNPPPHVPVGGGTIRDLSVKALQDQVISFAKTLRDFEASKRAQDYTRLFQESRRPRSALTEEERRTQFEQEVNEDLQRHLSEENDFRNRFLGQARAYEDELLRRLNIPTPTGTNRPVALRFGLAGPTPIADLADYLESFARQLRD